MDALACERDATHARQLRAMGFTINLAPVLDVNNNRRSVIGDRSYGASPTPWRGRRDVVASSRAAWPPSASTSPDMATRPADSHSGPGLPQSEGPARAGRAGAVPRAIAPDVDVAAIMSAHSVPWRSSPPTPRPLSPPDHDGPARATALVSRGWSVSDDLAGMWAITDSFTRPSGGVARCKAGVDLLIIAGGVPPARVARTASLAALARGAT